MMRRDITFCRFALTVLAVIALSSCTKTSTIDDTDDLMPMRFGLAGISTRATINGVDDLRQNGQAFSVWATYARTAGNGTSGQNFTVFDATKVTFNGTEWTYDNPQYWFPGFTYTFRALYPSTVENVTFDGSALQIDDFDGTQSIDLLLASPNAIPCGINQKMGKIALNFRHLLSRVAFVGRSDENHLGQGRQIIIDEAKLYGIHTTGNWSGTNAADTWTVSGTATNSDNTPYVITKVTYPNGLALTSEGVSLFANELFIPQGLTACTLEITYHYNVEIGTQKKFKGSVKLSDFTPMWEAGKSYRYPFTISNHIFFEKPTIDQWKYAPVNNNQDFNIYPTN